MDIKLPKNVIKIKFIDFLKDNGVYKKFMNEAALNTDADLVDYISDYNKIEYSRFIDCAFSWDDTADGIAFWSRIHDLWNDTLFKINKDMTKNLKSIW